MVLIFTSLMMLSTFSSVYWPFVYRLWRKVYSNPLPVFSVGLFVLLLSCKNSFCRKIYSIFIYAKLIYNEPQSYISHWPLKNDGRVKYCEFSDS